MSWHIGQAVHIVDELNGGNRHVCNGNVERLTKTLIIVRNQYGNESRFRIKDSRRVGYSWPHLTTILRPLES